MKSYVIFEKLDEETLGSFQDWLRNRERVLYRTAMAELAALKKLRPVYVRQKTREEQMEWMRRMLAWKSAEQISDHLLQVWLVRQHTTMLVSFLDTLGIKHNGQGVVDTLPELCLFTCRCSRTRRPMVGRSCSSCWITIPALPCAETKPLSCLL